MIFVYSLNVFVLTKTTIKKKKTLVVLICDHFSYFLMPLMMYNKDQPKPFALFVTWVSKDRMFTTCLFFQLWLMY